MNVLVVDIGGSNVKMLASNADRSRRFPSGDGLCAKELVNKVKETVDDWDFDRITVGYPGPVVAGKPASEPHNLGNGWQGFDFESAFGKPTRVINDAAMQALGSYEGGRMLFLGLGTGLGSALVIESVIAPMEIAHLPYRKGHTFEDYVGQRGLKRRGPKKWRKSVHDVIERLRAAFVADYVVLGGGNAKKLKTIPSYARLGSNKNAFVGGFRLWEQYTQG